MPLPRVRLESVWRRAAPATPRAEVEERSFACSHEPISTPFKGALSRGERQSTTVRAFDADVRISQPSSVTTTRSSILTPNSPGM